MEGNALIVAAARWGDATLDGKVDAFDLNLLAAHWQQQGGALWSAGDFTGDGKVDAFDLNILAGNWQARTNLHALAEHLFLGQGVAVPEAGTLGVLGMAALVMSRRPKTRE